MSFCARIPRQHRLGNLRGFSRQRWSPKKFSRELAYDSSSNREKKSLIYASDLERPSSDLPSKAKVVICGGGAQGAAIAYKLAQRGLGSDVVLIEQGVLGGGTTWHSSGLIGQFKNSSVETKLTKMSKDLYLELEDQGFYTGWKECGSLLVAKTVDRMHLYKRMKSEAQIRDVECHLVDLDRIKELCPLIRTDDLQGGLWIPGDGVANPFEICLALSVLAHRAGARIVSNCTLEEIVVDKSTCSVAGVKTNLGYVECEAFINSAGFWARDVGNKSTPRVHVPLHPAEHYYLHTKPVPGLPQSMPVVRDPDNFIYFRENEGRFLAGGFQPWAKPAFVAGPMPTSMKSRKLPVDWDHFHVLLTGLLHRVPSMSSAVLERLTNGPEAFSPDGEWILGQAPEVRNYYVATAMRSIGAGAAGGVGEVMADYITKGHPPFDMYNLDIKRFLPMHNNRRFLTDRVREVPGLLYAIPYPFQEYRTGRAQRTSPIFPRLRDAGARFNQVMGYERAMYFKKEAAPLSLSYFGLGGSKGGSFGLSKPDPPEIDGPVRVAQTNTFYQPPWWNEVQDEYFASRESVSLTDYSSFAKFDLWSAGSEVLEFLQYTCSNDIDIPVGGIVHTGMQNELGGYENDCSVARLSENHFMLMSPSIQQMRSYSWMKHRLPKDGSVYLQDVTSLYTTLGLMGPNSQALLSKLTSVDDLSSKAFPFFTCRHMDIGCAPDILTMNMTHTGELGYVFYIPTEFALHVYDELVEAGKEFDLKQCGYYATRALRIEKFYAFWGQDLDSHVTPLECGRAFRTKLDKNIDFIGRKALEEQHKVGIKKMLVMLLLDNHSHVCETDPWPWGGEPIFRNGVLVGRVTTTSFGFTLGQHVLLGFVHNPSKEDDCFVSVPYVKSGEYEVEIAGIRYPAKVRLNPPSLPFLEASYKTTRYGAK